MKLGDTRAESLDVENDAAHNNPVVYVNGILTDREEARNTGRVIGAIYDAPVYTIWNPSSGFLRDVAQTIIANKTNASDDTTRRVVLKLRELLAFNSAVTLIGHSQGAAVVSAALSFLSRLDRARVDVITFGGAAYRYPSGVRSLRVIVNIQDSVPQTAGYLAAERAGLTIPGIERVSFGEGRMLPQYTHGIYRYLEVEKTRRRSRSGDRLVRPVGLVNGLLGAVESAVRAVTP